eukprot:8752624-Alexandrium_andersonii.AAC.1
MSPPARGTAARRGPPAHRGNAPPGRSRPPVPTEAGVQPLAIRDRSRGASASAPRGLQPTTRAGSPSSERPNPTLHPSRNGSLLSEPGSASERLQPNVLRQNRNWSLLSEPGPQRARDPGRLGRASSKAQKPSTRGAPRAQHPELLFTLRAITNQLSWKSELGTASTQSSSERLRSGSRDSE